MDTLDKSNFSKGLIIDYFLYLLVTTEKAYLTMKLIITFSKKDINLSYFQGKISKGSHIS